MRTGTPMKKTAAAAAAAAATPAEERALVPVARSTDTDTPAGYELIVPTKEELLAMAELHESTLEHIHHAPLRACDADLTGLCFQGICQSAEDPSTPKDPGQGFKCHFIPLRFFGSVLDLDRNAPMETMEILLPVEVGGRPDERKKPENLAGKPETFLMKALHEYFISVTEIDSDREIRNNTSVIVMGVKVKYSKKVCWLNAGRVVAVPSGDLMLMLHQLRIGTKHVRPCSIAFNPADKGTTKDPSQMPILHICRYARSESIDFNSAGAIFVPTRFTQRDPKMPVAKPPAKDPQVPILAGTGTIMQWDGPRFRLQDTYKIGYDFMAWPETVREAFGVWDADIWNDVFAPIIRGDGDGPVDQATGRPLPAPIDPATGRQLPPEVFLDAFAICSVNTRGTASLSPSDKQHFYRYVVSLVASCIIANTAEMIRKYSVPVTKAFALERLLVGANKSPAEIKRTMTFFTSGGQIEMADEAYMKPFVSLTELDCNAQFKPEFLAQHRMSLTSILALPDVEVRAMLRIPGKITAPLVKLFASMTPAESEALIMARQSKPPTGAVSANLRAAIDAIGLSANPVGVVYYALFPPERIAAAVAEAFGTQAAAEANAPDPAAGPTVEQVEAEAEYEAEMEASTQEDLRLAALARERRAHARRAALSALEEGTAEGNGAEPMTTEEAPPPPPTVSTGADEEPPSDAESTSGSGHKRAPTAQPAAKHRKLLPTSKHA